MVYMETSFFHEGSNLGHVPIGTYERRSLWSLLYSLIIFTDSIIIVVVKHYFLFFTNILTWIMLILDWVRSIYVLNDITIYLMQYLTLQVSCHSPIYIGLYITNCLVPKFCSPKSTLLVTCLILPPVLHPFLLSIYLH